MSEQYPRTFELRKLVRDKIVEEMQARGHHPDFHVVTGGEKLEYLEDKAKEEAGELRLDPDDVAGSLEELADIQQVIDDAAIALGCTPEDVREAQAKKFAEKGGFAGGFFVRTVFIDPTTDPELFDYYSSHPDRFPPVKD